MPGTTYQGGENRLFEDTWRVSAKRYDNCDGIDDFGGNVNGNSDDNNRDDFDDNGSDFGVIRSDDFVGDDTDDFGANDSDDWTENNHDTRHDNDDFDANDKDDGEKDSVDGGHDNDGFDGNNDVTQPWASADRYQQSVLVVAQAEGKGYYVERRGGTTIRSRN